MGYFPTTISSIDSTIILTSPENLSKKVRGENTSANKPKINRTCFGLNSTLPVATSLLKKTRNTPKGT